MGPFQSKRDGHRSSARTSLLVRNLNSKVGQRVLITKPLYILLSCFAPTWPPFHCDVCGLVCMYRGARCFHETNEQQLERGLRVYIFLGNLWWWTQHLPSDFLNEIRLKEAIMWRKVTVHSVFLCKGWVLGARSTVNVVNSNNLPDLSHLAFIRCTALTVLPYPLHSGIYINSEQAVTTTMVSIDVWLLLSPPVQGNSLC